MDETTPEFRDFCQVTLDSFLKAAEWDKWTLVKESDGISVCKADIPASGPRPTTFKTVTIIPAAIDKVMFAMYDGPTHMQYDQTYRHLETLRKIKIEGRDEWEVDLMQVITNSAVRGWIASREFLDYRVKVTLPDKRQILCSRSVDELKNTPLKAFEGVVRGMNHPSGVICEPVEDGKATRFTEVVCTDLRGSLPGWVVSAGMSGTRIAFLQALRDFVAKMP